MVVSDNGLDDRRSTSACHPDGAVDDSTGSISATGSFAWRFSPATRPPNPIEADRMPPQERSCSKDRAGIGGDFPIIWPGASGARDLNPPNRMGDQLDGMARRAGKGGLNRDRSRLGL